MLRRLFAIDWRGPLTKGRMVFCSTRTEDSFCNVNFQGGFPIGWDRWSDGRYTLTARTC